MPIFEKPPRYRSYLLRFWEERGQYPTLPMLWRFSLQDPHTGERLGFPSLEALVTFLKKELNRSQDEPPKEG